MARPTTASLETCTKSYRRSFKPVKTPNAIPADRQAHRAGGSRLRNAPQRCDCGEQLEGAVRAIGESGRGALLYLRQEGRGRGLLNTSAPAGCRTLEQTPWRRITGWALRPTARLCYRG